MSPSGNTKLHFHVISLTVEIKRVKYKSWSVPSSSTAHMFIRSSELTWWSDHWNAAIYFHLWEESWIAVTPNHKDLKIQETTAPFIVLHIQWSLQSFFTVLSFLLVYLKKTGILRSLISDYDYTRVPPIGLPGKRCTLLLFSRFWYPEV